MNGMNDFCRSSWSAATFGHGNRWSQAAHDKEETAACAAGPSSFGPSSTILFSSARFDSFRSHSMAQQDGTYGAYEPPWSAEDSENPENSHEKELTNLIQQMKKQLEETRLLYKKNSIDNRNQLKQAGKKNSIRYMHGMSMLASAGSVSGVRTLIVLTQQRIQKLKSGLVTDSACHNEGEVRAAIAGLERVVSRAKRKIKHLQKEERIEMQRKKAEQERELKRAEQIRQELRKKRAARMSREYAQIFERPPSGGPAFCGRKADGVLGPGETPLGTADAAAGAPLPEAGPGAAVTGGTIAPAAAAVEPNLAAAFSAGVSEVAASVIDVMA